MSKPLLSTVAMLGILAFAAPVLAETTRLPHMPGNHPATDTQTETRNNTSGGNTAADVQGRVRNNVSGGNTDTNVKTGIDVNMPGAKDPDASLDAEAGADNGPRR